MNGLTLALEQPDSLSEVASLLHDLRSPLAAIHGAAEMLVLSTLSPPQAHRLACNMYGAAAHMRELVDEFLDRNRGDRKAQPTDIRELVTSAVDKIAVRAELQSVRIVQVIADGVIIALDRHRIRRVLMNLFVNALDVMPNGGTIHISAVFDRRSVLIKVRDTGPGIAPEIRNRLFQPFATAGKMSGVGLGLFFSRQAVTDHGGEIWVQSSRRGACFAVRLPRIIAQSAAAG